MQYSSEMIADIVARVIREGGAPAGAPAAADGLVPVGVSARHIHLTQADVETLFGKGYQLTPFKDLSQPGQYACKEQLTLVGPSMRAIEKVRVLGPVRKSTQVEISRTDSFVLKVKPPVRESGDIAGSAGVTIIGPKGIVTISEGCIIANRHIHMSLDDARRFNVKDGEYVDVEIIDGAERPSTFHGVQVRANEAFALEMHIDTDDANAAGIGNGAKVKLIKK